MTIAYFFLSLLFEPRCEKTGLRGFRPGPTQTGLYSHRRWLETRNFVFMNNQCSENKGADQLRGYREADLRLCFRICKKPVFSRRGSFEELNMFAGTSSYRRNTELF